MSIVIVRFLCVQIYFLHIILRHTVHLEDHKTRHITTFCNCADRHFFVTIPEFYILWRQQTFIFMCYIYDYLDTLLRNTVHLEDHKTSHLTIFIESLGVQTFFCYNFRTLYSNIEISVYQAIHVQIFFCKQFWNIQYI